MFVMPEGDVFGARRRKLHVAFYCTLPNVRRL
jgi:hypothetical protein